MVTGACKPRNPKSSALYQCVKKHFEQPAVTEEILRHLALCPALS
jgi:hypothetical protein